MSFEMSRNTMISCVANPGETPRTFNMEAENGGPLEEEIFFFETIIFQVPAVIS